MSICDSGINYKTLPGKISIIITDKHPLIQLAQSIDWPKLFEIILSDLKNTKSGQWWRGRKLKVKIHLGTYLLQQLYNKTDRQMEHELKDNAAFQLFCGRNLVDTWHAPDHTKIEEFRSRLSPTTQNKLANYMAGHAVQLGFADPSNIDIDSTVQEANMAYPADSALLKKLGGMAKKVATFLNTTIHENIIEPININLKKINSAARNYFFLPKTATQEMKAEKMKKLLQIVKKEIAPVLKSCEELDDKIIELADWNIKKTINQIKNQVRQYLKDVGYFIKNGTMVATKRLSFHLNDVMCCTKGKPGKKYTFGRVFQLCRLAGNFLFVSKCNSIAMPDKTSFTQVIAEHREIFPTTQINSVATDKGYYSAKNENILKNNNVIEIGIQRPANIKKSPPQAISDECVEKLVNRRSGIEPLIGHAKHGGQLGRSRMKSDLTIESSGYTSVLGLNMRQLIRSLKCEKAKIA